MTADFINVQYLNFMELRKNKYTLEKDKGIYDFLMPKDRKAKLIEGRRNFKFSRELSKFKQIITQNQRKNPYI